MSEQRGFIRLMLIGRWADPSNAFVSVNMLVL